MTLQDLITEARAEGKTYVEVGETYWPEVQRLSAEYEVDEECLFQGVSYIVSWRN